MCAEAWGQLAHLTQALGSLRLDVVGGGRRNPILQRLKLSRVMWERRVPVSRAGRRGFLVWVGPAVTLERVCENSATGLCNL